MAQCQTHCPLVDQQLQRMLYERSILVVDKTLGETLENMAALLTFTQ